MATVAAEPKGLSSQYVTFLLGNETYGISILKLNEIIAYQECTAIPTCPPSSRACSTCGGSLSR